MNFKTLIIAASLFTALSFAQELPETEAPQVEVPSITQEKPELADFKQELKARFEAMTMEEREAMKAEFKAKKEERKEKREAMKAEHKHQKGAFKEAQENGERPELSEEQKAEFQAKREAMKAKHEAMKVERKEFHKGLQEQKHLNKEEFTAFKKETLDALKETQSEKEAAELMKTRTEEFKKLLQQNKEEMQNLTEEQKVKMQELKDQHMLPPIEKPEPAAPKAPSPE